MSSADERAIDSFFAHVSSRFEQMCLVWSREMIETSDRNLEFHEIVSRFVVALAANFRVEIQHQRIYFSLDRAFVCFATDPECVLDAAEILRAVKVTNAWLPRIDPRTKELVLEMKPAFQTRATPFNFAKKSLDVFRAAETLGGGSGGETDRALESLQRESEDGDDESDIFVSQFARANRATP